MKLLWMIAGSALLTAWIVMTPKEQWWTTDFCYRFGIVLWIAALGMTVDEIGRKRP